MVAGLTQELERIFKPMWLIYAPSKRCVLSYEQRAFGFLKRCSENIRMQGVYLYLHQLEA